MATYQQQRWIFWLLAVSLVVTSLWAIKIEVDKRKLAAAYAQVHASLTQLEQEQAHLDQELTQARETLESKTNDLSRLEAELTRLQTTLKDTEAAQANLQASNRDLTQQLTLMSGEKQALEAKLSSIKDLKLAIHEVQRKLYEERWKAWRAYVLAQREADHAKLTKGNRGYVMRSGVSTLGSTTKLQVRVLDLQTQ